MHGSRPTDEHLLVAVPAEPTALLESHVSPFSGRLTRVTPAGLPSQLVLGTLAHLTAFVNTNAQSASFSGSFIISGYFCSTHAKKASSPGRGPSIVPIQVHFPVSCQYSLAIGTHSFFSPM